MKKLWAGSRLYGPDESHEIRIALAEIRNAYFAQWPDGILETVILTNAIAWIHEAILEIWPEERERERAVTEEISENYRRAMGGE